MTDAVNFVLILGLSGETAYFFEKATKFKLLMS